MNSKAKIITITGPESTGKSTLAAALSAHLEEPLVEEYARDYLNQLDRPYGEADLWEIAKGQQELIDQKLAEANQFLFVDTDAWTVYIWAQVKYKRADPRILQMAREQAAAHYFLCGIDVPWKYDPLRENRDDRSALYTMYQQLLQTEALPFTALSGAAEDRLTMALSVLRS